MINLPIHPRRPQKFLRGEELMLWLEQELARAVARPINSPGVWL